MEFSTKAEKLQPNQSAAVLYICTEAQPCCQNGVEQTAALLCASLEEGESFASAQTAENGNLRAVAVVRLKDLERKTLEKAAAEAAAWAQKPENLAICIPTV
ncbi:aminopeptidase, partial [Neisseria dumasiana]